jgi:hypothetical protein
MPIDLSKQSRKQVVETMVVFSLVCAGFIVLCGIAVWQGDTKCWGGVVFAACMWCGVLVICLRELRRRGG